MFPVLASYQRQQRDDVFPANFKESTRHLSGHVLNNVGEAVATWWTFQSAPLAVM